MWQCDTTSSCRTLARHTCVGFTEKHFSKLQIIWSWGHRVNNWSFYLQRYKHLSPYLSVTARQLDSGPVTLLQWEVEWEAREAREEVTKLVGKRRQVNSLTLILIIHSLTLKTLNAPFLWSSALSRETIMKYSNNVQKKVWNGFLILRTSLCAVPCPDVLCHGVGVPWCAMVCHGVPWCAWLCLFSGTTETDRLENETKP